jgi:hypothetical protein
MALLLEPYTPAVLSASTIQVDTPQRIPAPLLQPFQEQHQDVLLLVRPGEPGTPARLVELHEASLLAETAQAVRFRAYRQRVLLVVFPVGPTCHYSVQTWIDEVYLTRLTLRYQDPRYDRRWPCEGTIPVALSMAPPAVRTLFTSQQVRIVRELAGLPPERTAGDSAMRDRVLLAGTTPTAILPP